jgi:hypothetical protein
MPALFAIVAAGHWLSRATARFALPLLSPQTNFDLSKASSIHAFNPFCANSRFAQLEMTKYQLQASSKWSFDFMNESPIRHANSQFRWEAATLNEMPKFYHHIAHPTSRLTHQQPGAVDAIRSQLFSEFENICPLSRTISAPSMIIQSSIAVNNRKMVVGVSSASASLAASATCSQQRKITGERSMRPLTVRRYG